MQMISYWLNSCFFLLNRSIFCAPEKSIYHFTSTNLCIVEKKILQNLHIISLISYQFVLEK
jgi:hypothetical protein